MRWHWQRFLLATVPLYLNYQSLLLDPGGQPIANGPVELTFRITDADHATLYEETQVVESENGVIAALIGNTQPSGLTMDLFAPGTPRLLEVSRGGELTSGPMEIVSVPYALWSNRVAPGGVDADTIADGAVEIRHFSDGLIGDLAAKLLDTEALTPPSSAGQIGVGAKFIYSGASTVQGVLKDLDLAIKMREEKNVDRAGDTVTGTLTMQGGATITGLPAATQDGDAISYLDLKTRVLGGDASLGGEDLRTESITTEQIKDGAILSRHVVDGSLTGADLAPESVTFEQIKDGTIGGNKIGNNAILSQHVVDGSLTGADLAPESITYEH
ncbi:MAG: hypothetical protein HY543_09870, partial [Deltaproteobacteria bacterium]|nr:hypothetical protein [Deltaproteobacteria bacterium]